MDNIQDLVNKKLKSVETYGIPFEGRELNLVGELKKIPRAGKHLRLDKNNIILPKRSVYDHLISLGRNADIFSEHMELDINADKMAGLIAFHDLAEAIIGDVPYFTTSELAKGLYKSKEHKDIEEMKANELILSIFDGELNRDFGSYLSDLNNADVSEELRIFNFLDRVDPIINIWIYLSMFNTKIDIDQFLSAMDDFFINPNVIKFSINEESEYFVKFLQDKDNAKGFYKEGYGFILEKSKSANVNAGFIWDILNQNSMYFISTI